MKSYAAKDIKFTCSYASNLEDIEHKPQKTMNEQRNPLLILELNNEDEFEIKLNGESIGTAVITSWNIDPKHNLSIELKSARWQRKEN